MKGTWEEPGWPAEPTSEEMKNKVNETSERADPGGEASHGDDWSRVWSQELDLSLANQAPPVAPTNEAVSIKWVTRKWDGQGGVQALATREVKSDEK